MRRIGIIQVWQESNHFSPMLTRREDFESWGVGIGAAGLEQYGQGEEIGGFLRGLEDCEPVGLLMAQAWPGGPVSREARQWLIDELAAQLQSAGPLDGVLFALHGALVAEDEPDMDGLLLEQVRTAIGPGAPLVATLDMHAHPTPRMFAAADGFAAYHTNPHLDREQTGRRAARLLNRLFAGAQPTTHIAHLPMLVTGEANATTSPALVDIFQRLVEIDAQTLGAAIFLSQPYLDVTHLGSQVMVTTDNDSALAKQLAEELAEACWQRRDRLRVELHDVDKAIDRALSIDGRPVVIADGADATNSGAAGDSVHLLREMMDRTIEGGALSIMVDPEAVACAKAAGEGGAFRVAVGGKRDHVFSTPLLVDGRVLFVRKAKYVLSGHLGDHLPIDMGLSAAVQINDVTLLLVERPGPGSTPMMYRCVGLEPRDHKIVIVKSPAGFRAEFEPFAAGVILAAAPGCAMSRLADVPYTRISRPVWPLDEIDDWRDVAWSRERTW